ncbi:hypothetical protein FGO68_gene7402 [Halteria grandinella]|uniref:Uncharacterized protein n=1 Tax=Halteria grandinella TaxID=5974 RepID=A0A8J8NQ09_HALGN|nr:hypothetical protein FGO68_gene7402 [Halteria grandinella]
MVIIIIKMNYNSQSQADLQGDSRLSLTDPLTSQDQLDRRAVTEQGINIYNIHQCKHSPHIEASCPPLGCQRFS